MRWKARDCGMVVLVPLAGCPRPFCAGEASAGSMSIPGSGSLGARSISWSILNTWLFPGSYVFSFFLKLTLLFSNVFFFFHFLSLEEKKKKVRSLPEDSLGEDFRLGRQRLRNVLLGVEAHGGVELAVHQLDIPSVRFLISTSRVNGPVIEVWFVTSLSFHSMIVLLTSHSPPKSRQFRKQSINEPLMKEESSSTWKAMKGWRPSP